MYFTAVLEFFFFFLEGSMKDEQIVLKFALKMEVSLCQGFKQQESLCATEERKVVCNLCAVAQNFKDLLHLQA